MMNRQLWDSFIEQVDAQVEGDFIGLAAEYETVTGHIFAVDNQPQLLFSLLQQALMTEHSTLLKRTVEFINQLPAATQKEFQAFGRQRAAVINEFHANDASEEIRIASF